MKKALILLMFGILFSNICFASSRIEELKDEQVELMQSRQGHLLEIQKIEVRIVEINGALKELQKSEKK